MENEEGKVIALRYVSQKLSGYCEFQGWVLFLSKLVYSLVFEFGSNVYLKDSTDSKMVMWHGLNLVLSLKILEVINSVTK